MTQRRPCLECDRISAWNCVLSKGAVAQAPAWPGRRSSSTSCPQSALGKESIACQLPRHPAPRLVSWHVGKLRPFVTSGIVHVNAPTIRSSRRIVRPESTIKIRPPANPHRHDSRATDAARPGKRRQLAPGVLARVERKTRTEVASCTGPKITTSSCLRATAHSYQRGSPVQSEQSEADAHSDALPTPSEETMCVGGVRWETSREDSRLEPTSGGSRCAQAGGRSSRIGSTSCTSRRRRCAGRHRAPEPGLRAERPSRRALMLKAFWSQEIVEMR